MCAQKWYLLLEKIILVKYILQSTFEYGDVLLDVCKAPNMVS